ncbi:uncharacterized protein LOC114284852 isoform X1 [Camellia sinensis]|nr:uncharacterized protein LOC114284852 isoform X1 [Camellia sinensis]
MGSPTASTHLFSSKPSSFVIPNSFGSFLKPSKLPLTTHLHLKLTDTNTNHLRLSTAKVRATLGETDQETSSRLLVQEEEEEEEQQQQQQPNKEVEECVKLLKNAAKTRRVAPEEVLSALSVMEKAKLNRSGFLQTLGGSKSPGRTWMLIFTAENSLKSGKYFPITAVQRFDAAAKRIENGVYVGPLGRLTFEGRFSWKNRILAFIFERVRIKIGPFNPFEIQFGGKDEREPSTKDPFFIWFYIDEEIAVARGKSGGTAFWCRCRHIASY